MGKKTVIVDKNLLEKIQYESSSLPISTCADFLDNYLNEQFNYHWHDEFEFGLVLQGKVEYYLNQGQHDQVPKILNQGEGVFVNSKALHMGRQLQPGTQMFDIEFPANIFSLRPSGSIYTKNVLPILQLPVPGLFLSPENKNEKELLNTLYEFSRLDSGAHGYELQCIELVCKIWRQLLILFSHMKDFPSTQKRDLLQEQRIRAMLSCIHTHYAGNITIESIADSASISRSECFRCFKAVLGKTPTEYLCEYRISRAAQLLNDTEKTIFDISLSCGFNSASYFGKLFKEKCGVSPGHFRENARRI